MKTTFVLPVSLLVAASACGDKEEPPATAAGVGIERTAAEARNASASAPAPAAAPAALEADEAQVLNALPTLEDAKAAADREIDEQNAGQILQEIQKELGGGF
jgi:hypothetical protein